MLLGIGIFVGAIAALAIGSIVAWYRAWEWWYDVLAWASCLCGLAGAVTIDYYGVRDDKAWVIGAGLAVLLLWIKGQHKDWKDRQGIFLRRRR